VKLADKFNLSVAILLLLAPHAPQADEFPAHPLKLLVGAPAGGTTDTIARAIAEPMAGCAEATGFG
jgi:tripartite-type tricarboxylate transporter receptor subunit TctC